MYFKTKVDIPKEQGKITIRKGIYVMYETGRTYNKEKKYNVPSRVTIGKMCDDEDGKMFPNEKYRTYFPDEDINDFNDSSHSGCLRIGAYLIINKIVKESGLKDIIYSIFGNDAGLFIDLTAYLVIAENNAGQYYPDYAFNHPLFTDGYKICSDTKVSSFFHSITDDQRLGFMEKWNEGRDKEETIYVSYDSTNKNCQAGDIGLAEYGHAKGDKTKQIINVSVGYDHENREPIFYEEYPGSIVDISQLDYMINKAEGHGYKNIGFILDRGYFSKGNLKHLDEKGYPFVIMAKGKAEFIRGFVGEVIGTFETDRKKRIAKYHVFGKTIKRALFSDDSKERYVHVFYNSIKAAIMQEKFETEVERLERNCKKLVGKKSDTQSYEEYFRFEKTKDGIITAVAQKNAEIEKEKRYMGYFVIVTSKKMTAEGALYLYKSRDESEKLFRADKSFLGNGAFRVYSDESIKGKTLVGFVALIIRNRIYTYLDNAIEENEKKANYMTVPAAVKELEKIEIVRQPDGKYRLDHAVTAIQKVILKAFGISARSIPNEAAYIANELAKI